MRNEKGVTLIALVVTVIVMIIVASVSIRFATDDVGILTQTVDTKKDYVINQEKEAIIASYVQCLTDYDGEVLAERLEWMLTKRGCDATVAINETDNTVLEVTFWESDNMYTVDENMQVEHVTDNASGIGNNNHITNNDNTNDDNDTNDDDNNTNDDNNANNGEGNNNSEP